MNIVIFSSSFHSTFGPQVRSLAGLGHRVVLVTRDQAGEFGGDRFAHQAFLNELPAKVMVLSGRRLSIFGLRQAFRVRRELRGLGSIVMSVHSCGDPRGFIVAGTSPVVYTIHDPVPHPGSKSRRRALDFWWDRVSDVLWAARARRTIVHGEALVQQVPHLIRRFTDVRSVELGIDVRSTSQPVPEDGYLLIFGQMYSYKGLPVLMEAMKTVWEHRPNLRLVIAGRGPALDDVDLNDSRLTVIDRFIRHDEIDSLFAGALLTLLPYTQASQSGPGLESIARGIPVVASDVGGLTQLVHDPSFLAVPGNAGSFADAVLRNLDHGSEQRAAVLALARERFDWSVVGRAYVDQLAAVSLA